MFDLSGKWALVTGSSRGLGKGVALALAEAGADIVVNYAGSADKAAEVAAKIQAMGRKALVIQADVSKPEDVDRMFDEIEAKIGGVDILVNNAGVVTSPTFDDLTLEEWDRIFDCNIRGTFLCCKRAVHYMRKNKWGRIIQMSSMVGEQGALFAEHHYAATKGAQLSFGKTLARTEAKYGITVNAIAPGIIGSEMLIASLGEVSPTSNLGIALSRVPLGTLGTPADIGAAAVYLASKEAAYVTGTTIDVNGGMLMR